MPKFLCFILKSILISIVSLALFLDFAISETREDVRKIEIQNKIDKITGTSANENLEERKSASNIFLRGKATGHYTFDGRSSKIYKVTDYLIDAVTPTPEVEHIIVLRFLCSKPEDLFPVSLSRTTFNWKVDRSEIRIGQIDREGYARLKFSLPEDKPTNYLNLEITNFKKKIDLHNGPFEIFLNEKLCVK